MIIQITYYNNNQYAQIEGKVSKFNLDKNLHTFLGKIQYFLQEWNMFIISTYNIF